MAPSKTLPAIKVAFLNDQVRILSQPLEYPPGFDSQSTIPTKYVEQALRELNRIYRHHTKSVYPSLAIADVAQQIDYLYWNAVQPHEQDPDDAPLRGTDNLTLDKNIARLNEDLLPSDAHNAALDRLKDLADKRRLAQQKLQKYRALQKELAVLKQPEKAIQPQLATKDGPLAQELAKTRTLATKLAGKVAGSKRAYDNEESATRPSKAFSVDEEQNVQATLREVG